MNALYLIPLAGVLGMLFIEPVGTIIAIVGLTAVCLGAMWLTDWMGRHQRKK